MNDGMHDFLSTYYSYSLQGRGGKNQKNECKSVDDKGDLTCYGAINYALPKGADAKETNKVKKLYGGR